MFMLLVLVGVQFAMAGHARHVLVAAAQDAATDSARLGASADAADVTARAVIGPGGLVSDVTVDTARVAGNVTVTVSGDVASVIGFLRPRLVARSTVPIEVFVPEGER